MTVMMVMVTVVEGAGLADEEVDKVVDLEAVDSVSV